MEDIKNYPNLNSILSSHEPNWPAAADWLANALENVPSDTAGAIELAEIAEIPVGAATKIIKAVRSMGPREFLQLSLKEEHFLEDWVKSKARS